MVSKHEKLVVLPSFVIVLVCVKFRGKTKDTGGDRKRTNKQPYFSFFKKREVGARGAGSKMAWPEEERPLVATNGGPDPEETPTDKNDRAEARNRRMEAVKTIFACAVYLSVGPALILVNRHILKEVGFDYPMALSGLGLIGAWLSSVFLIQVPPS